MEKNIFGLNKDELTAELSFLKLPAYRIGQILEWIYRKDAADFSVMSNLPKNLRVSLSERFCINRAEVLRELVSADKLTAKFLLKVAPDVAVETVLMRHDYGNSLCVSTQAGCAMGCAFCASAQNGLQRSLTTGEILAQLVFVQNFLQREGQKISTIVIMGMGEPLVNYDNVLKFIRLVHEPYALNLGYRNITLSTSGIVPNIYRLAEENLPVNLAISLHAPTDELRSRLMPVNKKYPLVELLAAGKLYGERTKRRVTYEYILIKGVNDSFDMARQLAKLMGGQLAAVNIIPVNHVEEKGFLPPSPQRVAEFQKYLESRGVTATIRREMGAEVNAACGQLRGRWQ